VHVHRPRRVAEVIHNPLKAKEKNESADSGQRDLVELLIDPMSLAEARVKVEADAQGPADCRWPFVPTIRLRAGRLIETSGSGTGYDEAEEPVIELAFRYGSRTVWAGARESSNGSRDLNEEARARRVLESFGPVEVEVLDGYEAPLGERIDYVVCLGGDDSAVCAFTAHAVPQLKQMGWDVQVEGSFRWKVLPPETPWYANVEPDSTAAPEKNDWFGLELGVEVDGVHVNLLPALLELLQKSGPAADLEDLIPRRERPVAVPVDDGRFVLIPTQRLRDLLRVLHNLYDESRTTGQPDTTFATADAGSLLELDEIFADPNQGKLSWGGAGNLKETARGWELGAPTQSSETPQGLQATLRAYQSEGLTWLQHLRSNGVGGILADDMGLGKTLQTIAHVAAEKEAGRLRDEPALIVAPTSLISNWSREIAKFAPFLKTVIFTGPARRERWYLARRCDVVITSYPCLVRDLELYEDFLVHLLILDEAQAIKNPSSQSHTAVRGIQARHKLCLTGTPVENSLSELWAQFDFAMPGLLGSSEWFRHRYLIPAEREGNKDALGELRRRVSPFVMRRTKAEVVTELPPKTEIVRPIELRGKQRDLYESIRLAAHGKVRKAIEENGIKASSFAILDALMKLRQVCCDPRLVPVEAAQAVERSAKFELLMELLEQQLPQGRRVLIFSQFAKMLGLIGRALDQRGIGHTVLTGATANRQKAVDTFESRAVDVFLISLKAGGTGLNLTSADTVVHYDPWWNPAVQAQATDRAYRIGQTRPVFVYNLIAAGSVEERMLGLQSKKRALAQGILSDCGPARLSFSEEDVEGLMAPLT